MKYLKLYKVFENKDEIESLLNLIKSGDETNIELARGLSTNYKDPRIDELFKLIDTCKIFDIIDYQINDDFSIDVDNNVYFTYKSLTEIPLKFGKVTGNFFCYKNQLTSLKGCPTKVGGDFNCSGNNLTSLKGCPKYVAGNFNCVDNRLTTLEGLTKVGNHFSCYNNNLISLEGCDFNIEGDFNCKNNLVYQIYRLFRSKQGFIRSLDYNYFRGDNKINKTRLTHALLEDNLSCPYKVNGYVWE